MPRVLTCRARGDASAVVCSNNTATAAAGNIRASLDVNTRGGEVWLPRVVAFPNLALVLCKLPLSQAPHNLANCLLSPVVTHVTKSQDGLARRTSRGLEIEIGRQQSFVPGTVE